MRSVGRVVGAFLVFGLAAASIGTAASRSARELTLAVPPSLSQSGLLERLLPSFEKIANVEMKVVEREAAEAIKLAQQGGVDVLWLDDEAREFEAVEQGIAVERRDVMFGDLVLVGPTRDPAGVNGMTSIIDAVRLVAAAEAPFVSRGDDSALNRIERGIWEEAGITVDDTDASAWYTSASAGSRRTVESAVKRNGYTIVCRAIWLTIREQKDHIILVADDPRMVIQYAVMLVNPQRHGAVRAAAGKAFIQWLTSPAVQKEITEFTISGKYPFIANFGQRKSE